MSEICNNKSEPEGLAASASGPSTGTGKILLLGSILVAAGALAYLNSLSAPFLFDDIPHIVENRPIRRLWPPEYFVGMRRIGNLTFALNYAWGGLDPRGYRAVNIAVHLMAGLVLFGLIRRTLLLPRFQTRYADRATWLAFCAALLWTVHPLQTQSVTYIVQRYESLTGLFYLLCLYGLARGASARHRWPWYLLTILAFYLGMLTKPVMATAPAVALLYDRVFLAGSWREVLRSRWWVYAAFVLPAAAVLPELIHMLFTPSERHAGFALQGITPWDYLASQPGVITHYLRLAFWPDVLCLDYAWPPARDPLAVLLPGALILTLLGGSIVALRCWPPLGFLGIAFFLVLAPSSSIIPIVDRAFEHRMYLPLASLSVLCVMALDAVATRRGRAPTARWVLVSAMAIIAASLAFRTALRNRDYREPIRIWEGAAAVNPRNARAHFSAAMALRDQGRVEEAIQRIQTALQLNPNYGRAHANLAVLLAAQGDLEGAAKHFERAIELEPSRARNWFNYGNLLARSGDYEGARARFQQAVELDPSFPDAFQNLGEALYQLGRFEESAAAFQRALELDEERLLCKKRLAWLLAGGVNLTGSSVEDAIRLAEEAELLARGQNLGQDPDTLDILGAAYASAGDFNKAVSYAQRALALSFNSGNEGAVEQIQARIDSYRNHQAFRLQESPAD